MPRTTIVIPTYNRARWLPGAIESVLAQTQRDIALIVSDNASTDETPEVVARFDDPRLTYVRRETNCDLNSHFNEWLQRAETEFLMIVPDDDRLAPDAVALTEVALDAHPRAAFVHGRVDVVDEHDRIIAAGHSMSGHGEDALETGAEYIERSMSMSYRVHASSVNMRTEAVRTNLLDPRDYPVTDFGWLMRVALGREVVFLARTLASYRVHGDAYSAGAADVTEGGYVQGTERIATFLDVKSRFIVDHASQLASSDALRRRARRAYRRELLEHAANATCPQRRLRPTIAALRDCVRRDRAITLEPAAWRLLAGCLIGRRGVSTLKRALRRPVPA